MTARRAPSRPRRPGDRRRALDVLAAVETGGARAAELLGPGDPPFVRELVLGVLRRRATLDAVLGAFSKRALGDLDLPVLLAGRLGVYQLLFLDGVPARAAVSESVGALPLASQRAYLNGLLRTLDRESRPGPARRGAWSGRAAR